MRKRPQRDERIYKFFFLVFAFDTRGCFEDGAQTLCILLFLFFLLLQKWKEYHDDKSRRNISRLSRFFERFLALLEAVYKRHHDVCISFRLSFVHTGYFEDTAKFWCRALWKSDRNRRLATKTFFISTFRLLDFFLLLPLLLQFWIIHFFQALCINDVALATRTFLNQTNPYEFPFYSYTCFEDS